VYDSSLRPDIAADSFPVQPGVAIARTGNDTGEAWRQRGAHRARYLALWLKATLPRISMPASAIVQVSGSSCAPDR